MKPIRRATLLALLAAALYALNAPLSKLFLNRISPTMMAALLYLGTGIGLWLLRRFTPEKGRKLTKKELPYTLGMIFLDIAAPILLMLGLARTTAANASLLNNFEIVATSTIAFFVFKERISRRVGIAVVLVTLAGILLSFEGASSLQFSSGSLLVLAAACCWGLENNCTRMLSHCSSMQVTTVKGICSGLGSLIVALSAGERFPAWGWLLAAMGLGFIAFGLSINFYIQAQKHLGAAKTSAYYSVAPFLGVLFGLLMGERPQFLFYIGLVLMIFATVLLTREEEP